MNDRMRSCARWRLALSASATFLLTTGQGWAADADTGTDASTSTSTSASTTKPAAEQLTVTGIMRPYAASNASTATKSDMPVLETPRAVSTISRQLLNDQNAVKLEDALKNVAGVIPGGYYADWDYFRIRGFEASASTYIDGLLFDGGSNEELFGLDKIEVLKGPISGLYGSGPPGGMVNLITKKPVAEDFANVSMDFGSYGYYQPSLDAGARLNDGGTVYGRIEVLYRDEDSYVDYAGSRRAYVAPSLTWEISPQTKITFLGRYQYDDLQFAFPLPAAGTVLPNPNGEIPISRYVGEPDTNRMFERREQLGYQVEHEFNSVFTARQNVRLGSYTSRWENMLYPDYLASDNRTLYVYPYDYNDYRRTARVDTSLEANFSTGPIAHTVVAGVDYAYSFERSTGRTIDFSDPSELVAIDVFDPHYVTGQNLTVGAASVSHTIAGQTGLYLQEHAKLTQDLTATLGGRFDYATTDGDGSGSTNRHFSPQVGLTYAITPTFAAYANYAGSFNPQTSGTSFSGGTLQPETGENIEAGFKLDALEHRATALLSVYQLTRQNVSTEDPLHPNYYITAGEQRSKGIELEGTYEPLPGLQLTSAYTYIDARVTKDNSLLVGAPLINVPHNAFTSWIKYEFQDGPLQDFGVGVGYRYYTKQAGVQVYASDPGEAFTLPAYGVADAAVYYSHGPWSAQLNVKNFTDERYFNGSYNEYYVQSGEPLTVNFSISRHF
jgi:iron complex outermembrane recepter protein